jgi:signal recognition particle receptor subunit beta
MDDAPGEGAVNARIVYWGAEGAGKRTNLRVIHAKLRPDHRGDLRFLPTRLDPTITYGALPIELGEVSGVRTRIHIIAMPGEREAAQSRKQLLDRADGIVFVLDGRREKLSENLASLEELKDALAAYGRNVAEMPLVMQYNKRDLADPFALEELHRKLSMRGVAAFEAVAKDGTGVLQTLTTISKRVIRHLREKPADPETRPAAAAKPAAANAASNAATQARLAPPPPATRVSPPPGTTQLIDRAAFEATLANPAVPTPGTTQSFERVVSLEDSQPGIEAAPATYADPVAEAEALFDDEFETTKRAHAPAPPSAAKRAAAASLSLDDGDGGLALAIEPAGPAMPAPGGLRIPLWVCDASGKRRKLTLSLRLESEDA